MTNLELYVWLLTIIATATLAASAVMQAARNEYDFFGALVLAFVTGLGGGTVRDLLLDVKVFWIHDYRYILMVLVTVCISLVLLRAVPKGKGHRLRVLEYLDAMGLALFTVLGVQKALAYDVHVIVAVIMGVITGVVGGIGRDLLCNQQPSVLKSDIYATLSLFGGIAYILLLEILDANIAMIIVISAVFLLRVAVLWLNLRLPTVVKK